MQFDANYYDGISPRAKRVLVTIDDSHFRFTSTETATNHAYLISDCIIQSIQSKLGNGKRLIDLPDVSRLETDFQDLEAYLPAKSGNLFWQLVHYAENHTFFMLVTLLGTIGISVLLLQYGVPVLAKYAVMATPVSVEKYLGKQTLDTLDEKNLGYFDTTTLPVERQTAINSALSKLCEKTGDCPVYQLNFRKSPKIGANAFALPGDNIVITDELIKLTKNNDEIIAVLAHELAHIKGRHALQQTLEATLSGLIIVAITGDVSSIAANLPILVLNTSYSRDLESEADNYALSSLKTACIPTASFADILLKVEKNMGSTTIPEIISSHPDTNARVMPFLKQQEPLCKSQ